MTNFLNFTSVATPELKNFVAADGEINLFGEVGVDFSETTLASAITDRGDVVINVNSGGGSYYSGIAMYTLLKAHTGNVTVRVIGLAASAASVFAMAADKIEMGKHAELMIHNATAIVGGDKVYLARVSELLGNADKKIASIYAEKTGLSVAKTSEMMNVETWMGAEKAIKLGFATSLTSEKGDDDAINISNLDLLSIKNELKGLTDLLNKG